MTSVQTDQRYMKRALSLAARGRGKTNPNPMVGAVIVNQGTIVGEAYHRKAGQPHAEVLALHQAGARARGGTLYVTLEPCCHTDKRTSPCVPLLIQSGLRRVCVAMVDPHPQVHGQGLRLLARAGLSVSAGLLEDEAQALNRVYQHWVTTGWPFVILKGAMTLDGKIATGAGQSKWITGPRARQDVQQIRRHVDAVMVGIDTVLADNPELSARRTTGDLEKRQGRQPVRVVLDSQLRIPEESKILRWIREQPTIICTTARAPERKIHALRARDVLVWVLPQKKKRVSLTAVFNGLGQKGIASLLLEGGSTLNAAALQEGWVNEVRLYVAPYLLGGQNAKGLIGGLSPNQLTKGWSLENPQIKKLGKDWLIVAKVMK